MTFRSLNTFLIRNLFNGPHLEIRPGSASTNHDIYQASSHQKYNTTICAHDVKYIPFVDSQFVVSFTMLSKFDSLLHNLPSHYF